MGHKYKLVLHPESLTYDVLRKDGGFIRTFEFQRELYKDLEEELKKSITLIKEKLDKIDFDNGFMPIANEEKEEFCGKLLSALEDLKSGAQSWDFLNEYPHIIRPLEILQNFLTQDADSEPIEDEQIIFDLTVVELAVLLRLLKEVKILSEEQCAEGNMQQFSRTVSKLLNISSKIKGNDNISPISFANKFYTPEIKAIENIQKKLKDLVIQAGNLLAEVEKKPDKSASRRTNFKK